MFHVTFVRSCLIAGRNCIVCVTFVSHDLYSILRVSTMFAVSDLQRVCIGSGKRFIATTKSCTYVQTSWVVWEMTHRFGSLASGFAELSSWLGTGIQGGRSSVLLESYSFRSSAHNTFPDRFISEILACKQFPRVLNDILVEETSTLILY